MVLTRRYSAMALTSVLTLLVSVGVSRADCSDMVGRFDQAIAAKSLDAAMTIENEVYHDDICNAKDSEVKQRLLGLEINLAGDPNVPKDVQEKAIAAVRKANAPLHAWTDALGLADRLLKQRRYADAQDFYDKAISLAGTASGISDRQKSDVLMKASAAKILASNDDQGQLQPEFAHSFRDLNGSLRGLYDPSFRGVEVVPVPLPINFLAASTNLTPNGEKAASELFDALQQQKISRITLIGHTDKRGADAFNVKLSQARVQRVADYLISRGLKVQVTAVGKGWHQPFDTSVLPYKPNQDEVWALDRRVELVR